MDGADGQYRHLQAASSSRLLNDNETNLFYTQVKEINDNNVQTRFERIRAAMFPDFCEHNSSENDGASNGYTRRSCLQKLTEPSQMVTTAVVELLSLQDESELTTKAIPELIKLLSDRDETVVMRAAHMVHMLSREGKSVNAMANDATLVNALCSAMKFDNDTVRRDAVGALSHISEHAEGRMHLFRSGGIPELVRMLMIPVDAVRHYAITTLHNLLLYMEYAKEEIRACGGLDAMTLLLPESRNGRFSALLTDSLYQLLLDHPPSKLAFLALNGPVRLINVLYVHRDYAKLVYTAIRCIRAISVCPKNKAALMSLGILDHLENLISWCDQRAEFAALYAIRNLSDAVTKDDDHRRLIVKLFPFLHMNNEPMAACAAGILSNLTCNNICNKQTLCMEDGISSLCFALDQYTMVEEVTEPTLCTMRHCTARHPLASKAQSEICEESNLLVIFRLIATMRAPVVKAALGLVRNLALLPDNLGPLMKTLSEDGENVVTLAMDVLSRAGTQLRQDPDALADGVAMRELVESAISALHQLANNPPSAEIMLRNHTLIDMLIKLLSWEEVFASEDELLQRELLGLLYQLSKTPEGARHLNMYEPASVLADALHSKHKAVSIYASGVLKNLQYDNPMLSEELNTEVESALNGGDEWMHDGLEPELFAEMYQSSEMQQLDQPQPWQHPPPYQSSNQSPSWFDTDL